LPIRWLDASSFDKSVVVPVNTANALSPRSLLWAVRIEALLLAASMALAIGTATTDRAGVANVVATVAWGAAIAVMVVALIVPSPLGLTAVRVLLPATVPGAAVVLAAGGGGVGAAALASALLATVTVFAAETGEAMVQSSAYGDERRLVLRPPAASCWSRRAVSWPRLVRRHVDGPASSCSPPSSVAARCRARQRAGRSRSAWLLLLAGSTASRAAGW
jgi:hypothetical protein